MQPRFVALALIFSAGHAVEGLVAQDAATQADHRVVTTCAELRRLKHAEANRGIEARLDVVVTVMPGQVYSGLIVQDETTGLWVELGSARKLGLWTDEAQATLKRVAVRDRIRLTGVTERGGFAPVLLPRQLEILEQGAGVPEALEVTVAGVLSGRHDAQRVKVKGVVQESTDEGQKAPAYLLLKLVNSGGFIRVRVPRAALPVDAGLLDMRLEVSGSVISMHNSRAEMSGVIIYTDRVEDVRMLSPALPPQRAPLLSLASLRPYEFGGFSNQRRRIIGTVTYWQPGVRMVLQEENAAVEVTTRSILPLALGRVVEASGFVSAPAPICRLENAELRVIGEGQEPAAAEITMAELLDASSRKHAISWQRQVYDFHYRLVRMRGTLVDAFEGVGHAGRTLLLSSEGSLLPVRLVGAPPEFGQEWLPGSELAVTGVVEISMTGNPIRAYEPKGDGDVSLLLRDAGDVEVLVAASWWTAERLQWALLFGAGVIFLVLLLVWRLSRMVRRQAGRIARQNEAEIRFRATLDERNRLGADMHDGLQQFLAGLSMQLEVAQGSVELGRDPAPALEAAKRLLARLREDFRHCVNALRDTEVDMPLPEILERTAAIMRACHPVEIDVQVLGAPCVLPGKSVASVMLIVQEAVSNAVRHGRAGHIVLRCEFGVARLELSVQDDGGGFDLATAAAQPHRYGLHNMRSRAEQIGGTVQVESKLEKGTCVTICVPFSTGRAIKAAHGGTLT